jgi:crotonobetainyl-CoA:carnitine CoA-transferase CaiB-like acyl-CoA transferase
VVQARTPGQGRCGARLGRRQRANPFFRYINRNKKGITLDYKQPAGRALFLRLVEGIDVLVETIARP